MNIDKNKSICKGSIISKKILPRVVFLLAIQTGCSGFDEGLGIVEGKKASSNETNHTTRTFTEFIKVYEDEVRKYISLGTEVIYNATKLVIPVPNLSSNNRKLHDYDGFLFSNPTDGCDQFVKGDGTGVIIINQPTKKQVINIKNKINELNWHDPTIEKLKELYTYMVKVLDVQDIYNSNIEYVKSKLTKIENDTIDNEEFCGLYKRNDKQNQTICKAIFISGKVELYSQNTFSSQKFKNGIVIIAQEGNIRGVQPEKFIETYTHPNGEPIQLENLKKF